MSLHPRVFAYVSNAVDGDIAVFAVDAHSGHASALQRCPVGDRVMPLALAGERRWLWAATCGAAPSLLRMAVDPERGTLRAAGAVAVSRSYCALAVDDRTDCLFAASFSGNAVDVHSLSRLAAGDARPLRVVEPLRNAEGVVVDGGAQRAYASALGADEVVAIGLAAAAGGATVPAVHRVSTGPGFGPRHLCLSPCGRWLYVLSEFRATIAVFRRDEGGVGLRRVFETARPEALDGLTDGRPRPSARDPEAPHPALLSTMIWAADIHVRPDGRFVYVSERTRSLLLIYRVAGDGSTLEFAGSLTTEERPRGFAIDPAGAFLVACGENSDHISIYRIESGSGALTLVSRCPGGLGANWVELVRSGH